MSVNLLFNEVRSQKTPEQIARILSLHPNTIQRWIDLEKVPGHYIGDFRRILGKHGNADDQFYTAPKAARYCYGKFRQVAKDLGVDLRRYRFIEPAAGCGYFYQTLPRTRRIGVDVCPNHASIEKADYLLWQPETKGKYIVIGNPPFGLRGHLALQFINHSAAFADMVAFILPQLFDSDGKGVPGKRVNKAFRLAHSERLPADSFVRPDDTPIRISTIFQVWTKVNQANIRLPARKTCGQYIRVYSLSDGGTPASTRNKAMIGRCDIYLPSTCFSGMKAYKSFHDLPNQRGYGIVIHKAKREIKKILTSHDWMVSAFESTNGALNLRRSLIEDVILACGFHDV